LIGLLGGRFDPPHNGHVALARAALEQLPIDSLQVLVAARPEHQLTEAGFRDRTDMATAAFDGIAKVIPDPFSFTVDSVRGGRWGDAFFIVGADQAAVFDTWKEPEEILRWVKLAVGTRSGYPDDLPDGATAFHFDSPDISGTEVRERVALGEQIDDLVPPGVAQIIEERGLYS